MTNRSLGASILLGFGLCALPVFLGVLNHDEAWYLVVAGRVLAGERLYVDVFDTNPPLIIGLNLPVVLLARVAGISEILALRVQILALVAVALGLTGAILRSILPDRPRTRVALVLLTLFILVPMVGYDFSQREHLMMILAWPYLIMALGRANGVAFGKVVPWVVGALAGIGLSIKPHFALVWLAVESTLILRRGWRVTFRPEGLAIVAFGLSYAVAVLTITPEYLPWTRRIASVYYGAGGASFQAMASQRGTILTLLAVLGFVGLRPEGAPRRSLEVLLAADLGLLVIAIVQIKGFAYQFYPAMAVAVLGLGWLLVNTPRPRADPATAVLAIRGVLLLLVLSVAVDRVKESIGWHGRPDQTDTALGRMIRVAREHAKGGSVFVFSPVIEAGFTMVNYAEVGWASRHPALLFLPGCYPARLDPGPVIAHRSPDQMGDSERFLFESVIGKLLADRPTLLFVDETGTPLMFDNRIFRYLDYYAQDPRFVEFLRDYEPCTRVDQFQVYRRKGSGDGR